MLAKHALFQLSYGPVESVDEERPCGRLAPGAELVGLGRLELPTSRLSSARSNQLSYKPEAGPRATLARRTARPPPATDRPATAAREIRPENSSWGRKRNEGGDVPQNGFRLNPCVLQRSPFVGESRRWDEDLP